MFSGIEKRGGIAQRLTAIGTNLIRPHSPDSEASIWQRYPELTKIPRDRFPQNVFIIPDGNGRWAALRKQAVWFGHQKGAEVIVQAFRDLNQLSDVVPFVGAWGFSIDNLKRSPEEVQFLMNLFESTVRLLQPDLKKNNSRFIHIGRKDIFEERPSLGEAITEVEDETRGNTGQVVYVAIGFSGEDQDMRIIDKARQLPPETPTIPEVIACLRDGEGTIPPADLLVRTSGEQRLSDVGWLAGRNTELYFSDKYFPDITISDMVNALVDFSKRDRRFGGRPTS
ncbi:polyprenyl diphosphate synthase [Patescibacteria group bacterium]|nr:polyprenyl diphosphate synthase [Patescibacteria group bacterium]